MSVENSENTKSNIKNEIYGSFFLSNSEFAISVTHVQEVVNTPEKYTSLPLSPAYVVGLFNLRGTIIPVVDIKVLLNMPSVDKAVEQRIAIIELRGHRIGLLFDKTGEIFRSREEELSQFKESQKQEVISGVFKKQDGKRIIQIINTNALFDLESIPKQDFDESSTGRHALKNRRGTREQCISFVVGPAQCALGISEIHEIIKVDQLSSSVLGGGFCIGIIDLRGTTVPVIDFAALLDYRTGDTAVEVHKDDRRVIVFRLGDELFGLLVESVNNIVSYYKDDFKKFPMLPSSRREMFKGCISVDGGEDILLLDQAHILSNNEVQQITHGHSQLYKSTHNAGKESKVLNSSTRRTLITFRVDQLFAIGIGEVKEIIEYPQKLMQPPGLPKHCKGVLNLRGDLIPVIDAHAMYGLGTESDHSASKVLIFKHSDTHFGLVVDSVEAIVSVNAEANIRLPEILYAKGGSMSDDVVEAVRSKNAEGQDQDLLILSSAVIAKRIQLVA